ncbi:MAG: hypothetical protein K6C94_07860, partial [Candidatus Gastranaerophilales bacterium]|nr:hypothetical protein [Candidatus Gastranaerophilales bacterium]
MDKIIKRLFAIKSQYRQDIFFCTHSFFFSFEEKKKERVPQEKSGFCLGRRVSDSEPSPKKRRNSER